MRRTHAFNASLCLIALLTLSVPPVHADDYRWFMQTQGYEALALSPDAAAADVFSHFGWRSKGSCSYSGMSGSQPSFLCPFEYLRGSSWKYDFRYVYRVGTGCTTPYVYNSDTMSCELAPSNCEAKEGESVAWSLLRPNLDGLGPIEYACESSCRIALGTSTCQPTSEGATTGVCFGVAKYTGEDCHPGDASSGGTPPTDPDPDPDPDPVDPTDPPTDCDSSTDESCPPDDGEGDGDGDEDGDGDGTGDGEGEGEGEGDGTGDGEGDGTGNGNGNGQCDPATDPNQCKPQQTECDPKTDPNQCIKPNVDGEACDTPLVCEGDVIQCAILRKNKEQLCQWVYNDQVRSQIASELAGDEYQMEEESIAVDGLFTEALNKGRFLPHACPAPRSFTVMGRSYSFSWEPICRFAEAIGPLIVALASIFFAVFIGRGIKGS